MNILVTGAHGFLGQHLMTRLRQLDYDPYGVSSKAYDLRQEAHLDALFRHVGKPDIIFHLAAHVGGIAYNSEHPGAIFYDNVMMTTQLIQQAMHHGCGKFVMAGSVCAYPQFVPIPAREHHLWQGFPERVDCSQPINVAGGQEISIRRLAEQIANLCGYTGQLEFDHSRPNGQLRRGYNIQRAKDVLGWQPQTDLETGLKRTIEWWQSNQ